MAGKTTNLAALRKSDPVQLGKQVAELKLQLDQDYAAVKAGKKKNTSHLKQLRREIAQILSIMREGEIKSQETAEK